MQGALDQFMGFFKAKKAANDEAEKEGMQGKITQLSQPAAAGQAPAPDQAQKLAAVKAAYVNKYGVAPASAADFLAKDAVQGEEVAKVGDAQRLRKNAITEDASRKAFTDQAAQDPALSATEKSFYGMKPEAYGDRLKPASVTYLPTDQGFIAMPTKSTPGGTPTPAAGPLQLPGGQTPKPLHNGPAPTKWTDKVDDQGNIIQIDPVTGETRNTGVKAPAKPGTATSNPQELAEKAQQGIDVINKMIGSADGKTPVHPGFSSAVGAKGASSLFGVLKSPMAGSDAADFNALKDQITGQAFLEARQQLKGSGAITDFEGKKAEGAVTRMSNAQSEGSFIEAAKEFRTVLQTAKDRAAAKMNAPGPATGAPGSSGGPLSAPARKPAGDPLGLF